MPRQWPGTPPPAAPVPASGAVPGPATLAATSAPQATAVPAAKPIPPPAAGAINGPASAPTAPAAVAIPTAGVTPAAAPAGQARSSCKVAQVYTSPTSDLGWSWSHEQSFLSVQKELPSVDLSIRGSVPDDNKQAVEDLLESMVQQGARVVFTAWFGFIEPTRAVAKRHLDVAFYQESGSPVQSDPENLGYYFATIEEARYISGEIAGLAVEPGGNIGYVAAHPIPEVFRGENAFALGVLKTNPTAKVYNKWTLTWFDPNLEKQAAESLLEPPAQAELLAQHQDSPATQLVAQEAGKLGIGYDAVMNDNAPRATLTAPVWNWAAHYKYTIQPLCSGTWLLNGLVRMSPDYRYWMGSMHDDGMIGLAPLNVNALANHPRKDQIQKVYNEELAAFKSGQKNFQTVFTGPIKDNTGQVRIKGKPDIAALYDERAQWFVENVVGSPNP